MALSQKQIDETVAALFKTFDDAAKSKDVGAVVACYHPHAAFIAKGQWGVYGTKEIEQKMTEFFAMEMPDFKNKVLETQQTGDGGLLFVKAVYYPEGKPEESKAFQQILVRGEDGKFLIYHDEFEM